MKLVCSCFSFVLLGVSAATAQFSQGNLAVLRWGNGSSGSLASTGAPIFVDQFTTKDVRASAQSLFNVVLVGFGTIVGNLFAGYVGQIATQNGVVNFRTLFSVPMWVALVCLSAVSISP